MCHFSRVFFAKFSMLLGLLGGFSLQMKAYVNLCIMNLECFSGKIAKLFFERWKIALKVVLVNNKT